MALYHWLLTNHPFFRELRERLLFVLESHEVEDLDELVVRSRRPARTVLLGLDQLVQAGEVAITPGRIVARNAQERNRDPGRSPATRSQLNAEHDLGDLATRYIELAQRREAPALLWGQRRLIPASAVERCLYVLQWLEQRRGNIMFLGDDDLVSPIVAAAAPGWNVHVVDIDRGVLETAQRTAEALGARIHTHHADLSQITLEHESNCHVVVSDPFPSGDGSFESVFWSHVARVLRPEGTSITTVAPSHKPLAYSVGALQAQQALGLFLMDLRADFGRYEAFDFEYIPFERQFIDRHGLTSTIAFTKSLMAAKKLPHKNVAPDSNSMDFAKWSAATVGHYLTQQAGVESQRLIAQERGFGAPPAEGVVADRRGMRVDLLLPAELRSRVATASPADVTQAWAAALGAIGAPHTDAELNELARLSTNADIQPDGPLAQIGLAVRAIESWERWRLDQ